MLLLQEGYEAPHARYLAIVDVCVALELLQLFLMPKARCEFDVGTQHPGDIR